MFASLSPHGAGESFAVSLKICAAGFGRAAVLRSPNITAAQQHRPANCVISGCQIKTKKRRRRGIAAF